MASFTTRIELEGTSTISDYQALHNAMRSAGFNRTIVSNDGIEYHLPNAEYNISGSFGRDEILTKAKQVLATINKQSGSVLVTESNGRTWSNLRKV